MTREEKSQVIEVLTTQLTEGTIIYLADISGLNALQTSNLRRACFKANIKLAVFLHIIFLAHEQFCYPELVIN